MRSGFTLIELLVAITLTGIVALLVVGTAHAGLDTRERVEQHRAQAESHMIVRALLADALRHPQEGGGMAMNDTLFLIDNRFDDAGMPIDAMRFVSRGIRSPLGATVTWVVTLTPTTAGLRLYAVPTIASDAAPIDALLADVHGLSVHALDRTADTSWLEQWEVAGRVPAAVSLQFFADNGAAAAPPLVVHTALERVY